VFKVFAKVTSIDFCMVEAFDFTLRLFIPDQ